MRPKSPTVHQPLSGSIDHEWWSAQQKPATLCLSDVFCIHPLQQASKDQIDLRACLGFACNLSVEALTIAAAPCPELGAFKDLDLGVLRRSALEVIPIDIAVAPLPLPRTGCIECGKHGIDRSAAGEIV